MLADLLSSLICFGVSGGALILAYLFFRSSPPNREIDGENGRYPDEDFFLNEHFRDRFKDS